MTRPSLRFGLILMLLWAIFSCLPGSACAGSYPRYICLSDHLNLESYENGRDTTISWDGHGVILSKGLHHPVTTAIYGILCYDRFKDTGDSAWYGKFMRQAAFFYNYDFLVPAFGEKGYAFEYNFPFHDLQPPWHSGMAQGMAISMLLRYRELSGDKSIDGICHKLAYFMMQPEAKGGTIGRLENGWPWIEEYPRSLSAPHVLNGSINAWIGLHEYCEAFPREKEAALLRDSLLQGFVDNLSAYTKNWWCRYDRGRRDCTPSYLRYHIFQMRQLYALTGREIFRHQEAIWAAMLAGMPIEEQERFSNREYEMAAKAIYGDHGWCIPDFNLQPEIGPDGAQGSSFDFPSVDALKDFLANKPAPDSLPLDTMSQKVVLMQFDQPIHANYITLEYLSRAPELKISLMAITRANELVPLRLEEDRVHPRYWQALIDGVVPGLGYNRLVVVFTGPGAGTVRKLKTGLFDTRSLKLPEYGFYRTAPIAMGEGSRYNIVVPRRNVDELMVFHRHSEALGLVEDAVFSAKSLVKDESIAVAETGHYQFLVIYRIRSIFSLTAMLRWDLYPPE